MPALGSETYCRHLKESLSEHDGITDFRINTACNNVVVSYDPVRLETEDLLALLEKPHQSEPKAPASTDAKKAPAKATQKAPTRKKAAAKPQKGPAKDPAYFKPAVTPDVQERIRQIIENEDPQKPISDGRISEMLKAEKMGIARRTVAKYREILGIPPSNRRKE